MRPQSMSDYAEWDAASVDLASEIVKEHGRKIEGAALVKIISAKLTKAGHSSSGPIQETWRK